MDRPSALEPTATGRRLPDGRLALSRTPPRSPALMWAAITDPDRTARWFGRWSGDPASGTISVTLAAEKGAPAATAHVLACEAPRRLVLEFPQGEDSWTIELTVSGGGEVSTVTLAQAIADPEAAAMIGPGWEFYLDRLVAAAEGRDLAEIVFEPDYVPELCDHYRALYSG